MHVIPPAAMTMDSVARHLQVGPRRAQALLTMSRLNELATLALGHSRGTYRLIPELGIALLRQFQTSAPLRVDLWRQAVHEVIASSSWRTLCATLREIDWRAAAGGGTGIETVLQSPALGPAMEDLHDANIAALQQYGLDGHLQVEVMQVDRLESAEEAVVLVGPRLRPYLLSRALLRVAVLDREKAWGVLVATRTATGVTIDVWPAVGITLEEAVPDPDLWVQRIEVGR
jgi:hypothetical protein